MDHVLSTTMDVRIHKEELILSFLLKELGVNTLIKCVKNHSRSLQQKGVLLPPEIRPLYVFMFYSPQGWMSAVFKIDLSD